MQSQREIECKAIHLSMKRGKREGIPYDIWRGIALEWFMPREDVRDLYNDVYPCGRVADEP